MCHASKKTTEDVESGRWALLRRACTIMVSQAIDIPAPSGYTSEKIVTVHEAGSSNTNVSCQQFLAGIFSRDFEMPSLLKACRDDG